MKKYVPFLCVFLLAACGHDQNPPDLDSANGPVLLPAPATSAPATSPPTAINAAKFVEADPVDPMDAFIQEVYNLQIGEGGGSGAGLFDVWLFGPPYGLGEFRGSADTVSLGNNGGIILKFPRFVPINGAGPDFIVFENAFYPRGSPDVFAEPAVVSVSQDGFHFVDFPCDPAPPYAGCAGVSPVLAHPNLNPSANPRDPTAAGGDPFDLADIGMDYALYFRIRDLGTDAGGNSARLAGKSGFDLDAVAIIHGAKP